MVNSPDPAQRIRRGMVQLGGARILSVLLVICETRQCEQMVPTTE
jgi:hypothetical protein